MTSPLKLRVYLVEDSLIMSKLLRELVQANGASVVGQSDSAPSAIVDIELLAPDVVVVDIGLREGSGFDVLKAIRQQPAAKQPVRIVLSNYALPTYRSAAARMGAGYYFEKSNQIPELVDVMRQLCNRDDASKNALN
jgi:CheY-like chemotaxis protein